MTAVLAATMVQDGLVDWRTTPADALRDIQDPIHPGWNATSLQHLLRMTGGVTRTAEVSATFERWLAAPDRSAEGRRQRSDLARAILSQPPSYPPGSQVEYSNHGYALAGHMLESVADEPFETLMDRRLFTPLGLGSAGFGAPGKVWGHGDDGRPVEPGPDADNPAMLSPAGRVHMNLLDYARFLQFLMAGQAGESFLLPPHHFEELLAPGPADGEAYAMGWEIRDELGPGVTVLAHTGSNTLWYAYAWLAPERDFGAMVVTNQGDSRDELDAVIWRLVVAHFERQPRNAGG